MKPEDSVHEHLHRRKQVVATHDVTHLVREHRLDVLSLRPSVRCCGHSSTGFQMPITPGSIDWLDATIVVGVLMPSSRSMRLSVSCTTPSMIGGERRDICRQTLPLPRHLASDDELRRQPDGERTKADASGHRGIADERNTSVAASSASPGDVRRLRQRDAVGHGSERRKGNEKLHRRGKPDPVPHRRAVVCGASAPARPRPPTRRWSTARCD